MSPTVPMVTPRNLTGDPTSSPCTDSSKYDTALIESRWKRRAPSQNTLIAIATIATTTKRPSFQWLVAVVATSARVRHAVEERVHAGIVAVIPEGRRRAARDDAAHPAVDEDAVAHDRVDARQLVGDDHGRHAEALAEREDELVEVRRGHGIEAGGRLVEEEQRRVERERARDPRPL